MTSLKTMNKLAFNHEQRQLMELNSKSLHIFLFFFFFSPSVFSPGRQRGIERGWCFNHGRGAHCDVRPPLGSLIVSGQAGSADHPASGMANDSHSATATHIERCLFVCVCPYYIDQSNKEVFKDKRHIKDTLIPPKHIQTKPVMFLLVLNVVKIYMTDKATNYSALYNFF